MALEDMTGPNAFLERFVIENPELDDAVSQGDSHLRGLKNCIVNSFAAMDGLMSFVPGTPLNLPGVITGVPGGPLSLLEDGGFVGIGVANPTELLHMRLDGNVVARLESLQASGVGVSTAYVTAAQEWQVGNGPGTGTNNLNFHDVTAAIVRMSLNTNGQLGIGTFSPSVKLDLVGETNVDATMRITKAAAGVLQLGADRDVIGVPFIGSSSNDGFAFMTSNAEVARFDPAGNLGIGTVGPQGKVDIGGLLTVRAVPAYEISPGIGNFGLYVQGEPANPSVVHLDSFAATVDTHLAFGTNLNGAPIVEAMRINSARDIGIGIAAPTERLHVVSGVINSAVARFTGANTNRGLLISVGQNGATNDAMVILDARSTVTDGAWNFNTDGVTKLVITGNHTSILRIDNATMSWRNNNAGQSAQIDIINGDAYTWRTLIDPAALNAYNIRDITGGNALKFQIAAGISSLLDMQNRSLLFSDPDASTIKFGLRNDFKRFDMQVVGGTNDWELFDDNSSAVRHRVTSGGLHLLFLPIADPGSPGALWNNNGVVNVSP